MARPGDALHALADEPVARLFPLTALPRAPVLDWSSFRADRQPDPAGAGATTSVQDLPSVVYTTSGRAAIYQALLQLALPEGSCVLVPTYHCPTMVAPVLRAGMRPGYFGLRPDGLPDIAQLDRRGVDGVRVIIVAHYFGLPRSLAEVRSWCDARGIALIEDCAHCYFGQAGERPVGSWGDYATASLSKFFPVPEAGLLGSAHRSITPLALHPQSAKAQVKGCVDVLEFAVRHRRLAGVRPLLSLAFALKNRRPKAAGPHIRVDAPIADSVMRDCDMDRIGAAPLWASMALNRTLPRQRVLARRRENFAQYRQAFANVPGARPLFENESPAAAPYVFPLWVDDADRVYQVIRALELPVFRWDRIWPDTPSLPQDTGPLWCRHVLQLLCHHDLRPDDIARTAQAIRRVLHPANCALLSAVAAGGSRGETAARSS